MALILALSILPMTAHAAAYTVTTVVNGNGSVTLTPEAPEAGEEVTITAKADDGWVIACVTVADSDTQLSKITYNSQSWTRDTNEFMMPEDNVTVTVDFVRAEKTLTVTLDPNGGSGAIIQRTVAANANYVLPECSFTKTDCFFYKWEIDGEYYDPDEEVTLYEDTTIKAIWGNNGSVFLDQTVDESTTEVVAKLVMNDSGTGMPAEYIISDERISSTYSNAINDDVSAHIEECKQALTDTAANYNNVQNPVFTVSDPEVVMTEDNRIYYTFEEGSIQKLATGSYARYWQITVTLTADCASVPMNYFSVWMSDTEQHPNTGGGVMINYLLPDQTIPADDGSYWETSTNQSVPEDTVVTLTAIPAFGYTFAGWYQSNINKTSTNDPHYLENKLISNSEIYTFTGNPVGEGEAPYICAVFEYVGEGRQGDQIQVWTGNPDEKYNTFATSGGQVAIEYTPSEPNIYHLVGSDGTGFASAGIIMFYKGDEITVHAKADDGFTFKGWYHVNIDFDMSGQDGSKSYQGDVISTDPSFTYKPGETVIEGDDEPLRYICAVFEKKGDAPEIILGDADGDGDVTILDATTIQRHLAELSTQSYVEAACDADGDGDVTILDATSVQRWLADLPTNQNIGKPIA